MVSSKGIGDFQIGDLVYRPPEENTFMLQEKLGVIVGIKVDDVGYECLTIRWNNGYCSEAIEDEVRYSITRGYWVHYPVKK